MNWRWLVGLLVAVGVVILVFRRERNWVILAALLLASLIMVAPASAGSLETRYWFGAQQGQWAVLEVGSLRYQWFAGTYVADAPTFYSVTWERLTLGSGTLYAGFDHVAWGAPFSASYDSLVVGAREVSAAPFTWDVALLATGYDVAVGLRMGDIEVGFFNQRRGIGEAICSGVYCENSGPYISAHF